MGAPPRSRRPPRRASSGYCCRGGWPRRGSTSMTARSPAPLTGPEAAQALRATSKPVTNTSLSWPGGPGEWNPQYGYGIPDLYRAMQAVKKNRIPPSVHIDSPQWYQLYDPTKSPIVNVTGSIEAPHGPLGAFKWVLQAGVGANPTKKQWFTIGSGGGAGGCYGALGRW